MPEVVEQQPEIKDLDAAQFIKDRNAADAARRAGKEPEAPKPGKPVEKTAEAKTAEPEDDDKDVEYHTPKLPRSVRRELNTLRERAAAAEARAKAFEEMGLKPKEAKAAAAEEAKAEDPEPQRKDFADDAQYNRALGRWDARQEAAKVVASKEEKDTAKQQEQAWLEGIRAMDAKAAEDVKLISDWDETAKAMEKLEEEDPGLKFVPAEQPTLFALFMQSDVRAFMYHHFAKKPDDLRKILAMPPTQQIPFFNRLEGRVESMYSTEKTKEAAQASEDKSSKDRQDPAEGSKPGRTAAATEQKPLPRPSTEVAARGGSAPPEEPAIGSKAWMAQRNQMQFARH